MTLNHVEIGTGTPVLALHGWTPDHRLMLGCLEPVFARRPGYRRLYPDLPAMGKSPATSVTSSDDMLAAVREFVAATVGDEPFLLVGESYGGYLARGLARALGPRVLGLALVCPIGVNVEHADRNVPPGAVLRPAPELISSLDPALAAEFTDIAVVETPETVRRFQEEILSGLAAADTEAMARIRQRWLLSANPEDGDPFSRPALILAGRQDDQVGYVDQFALLPHYPRATYAVLDVAGHNLQIEQPTLFEALVNEWLDRVEVEC
ncbi:alpha/beta hydrolase [Actinophytocola sp.]|uniref:alpha/beta fold hydrolase n=1 Tax=Actinophytocola sp. TaxID=1872138 RepID=UPI002ED01586